MNHFSSEGVLQRLVQSLTVGVWRLMLHLFNLGNYDLAIHSFTLGVSFALILFLNGWIMDFDAMSGSG